MMLNKKTLTDPSPKKSKSLLLIITSIGFIAGIITIFTTQNSFGGGDSTQHFNLAYWGWEHPHLLFDHWGKPLFTILISPMAQFGMNGARIFNLIFGIATGIIIWRIAVEFKFKRALLSMFFVIFTPIYFILIFTPLTEVLYSFFITLSILLFFKKKYYLSAIILSFTPLIRNEGIVLIPVFLTAYLLKKKYLTIPLLSIGFLFISLLGYPIYKDFWWLITQMPYMGDAGDIYGSGSILHFIGDTRGILGYPIGYLLPLGLIIIIHRWVKTEGLKLNDSFFFILLVVGSYIVFLSAHSYVWWKGIGNSLGLVRVMGSVTPLAALTAFIGFSFLIDQISRLNNKAAKFFTYGSLFWMFMLGIATHQSGFNLSKQQQLITESSGFIINNDLAKDKIFYYDPFVPYSMGIDPYNINVCQLGVVNKMKPSLGMPDNSLLIWDSHFGPNEGRTPLNILLSDKNLELIETFTPPEPVIVLGGYNYEVKIFRKITDSSSK